MEHAVIVHLRLSDDSFGSRDERELLLRLESALEEALVKASAGELDGNEFGMGECVLYLYGADADNLFATIEPLLRASPQASGGYAIKRYGEASDADVVERRVEW